MPDALEVWDRALDYGTDCSAPGDRALRDALTFHGSVENGGLLNAVESYAEDSEFPLPRVIEAYRYFGLDSTASLITTCATERRATSDNDWKALERLELRFDPQYSPDDDELTASLEAKLTTSPGDFEPTS